jgi:hypothetical protein
MHLFDYPMAIAKLERQSASLQQQAKTTKGAIAQIEAEIEAEIAFNPELKNDTQRKAKRTELMRQNDLLNELNTCLKQYEGELTETEIELSLRRNQFSVAKLERRAAIAQMELQARTAA